MTSIPGSKNFTVAAIICCMSAGMLVGAMFSQRRNTITLYERKLERSLSELAERNLQETGSQILSETDLN